MIALNSLVQLGQNQALFPQCRHLALALIVHHPGWLEYAKNGRMGCGIAVTDRNTCDILG